MTRAPVPTPTRTTWRCSTCWRERCSFLAGDRWIDAARGSFLRIPAGVTHDFENRSGERAGALNLFLPGGFEPMMLAIVDWFVKRA